jgi:hypothetical protein
VRASLWLRRLILLLAGSFVPIMASSGQTVSAHAVVAAPKHSAHFSGVTERMDGSWVGGAVEFEAGRLRLSVSGMRGRLTAADAGSLPNRDVGELSLDGQYRVRPWLGLELCYTARAFSSAAGYQRWDLVGVGAAASRDLGTPAMRAFASLLYFPMASVSHQERPRFALGSDVGIALAPSRLPLTVALSYRIERFGFPDAAARSEQFEALTLSLGVRARRHAGRWTLGGQGSRP